MFKMEIESTDTPNPDEIEPVIGITFNGERLVLSKENAEFRIYCEGDGKYDELLVRNSKEEIFSIRPDEEMLTALLDSEVPRIINKFADDKVKFRYQEEQERAIRKMVEKLDAFDGLLELD